MDDPGYTAEFSAFVRDCIPNSESAAVLACIVRGAERDWSAAEIAEYLRSSLNITTAEAQRCIELFESRALVERVPGGRTRISSAEPQASRARALMLAYDHKPVTLVRLIYAMREKKIRLLSDAFRIRKD